MSILVYIVFQGIESPPCLYLAERHACFWFCLTSQSLPCFLSFTNVRYSRVRADVRGFPAPPDAYDAKRSPGGAGVLLPETRPSGHVLRRGGAPRQKSRAAAATAIGRRRRW